MHTFRIKIGNLVTDVHSNYSYIEEICKPYLSDATAKCDLAIDADSIESERKDILELHDAFAAKHWNSCDWFLEVYALLHKILPLLPEYNMLFMHGSAILYKEKAYIFIAPSGTGKSTHSRLWKERFGEDVIIINDDKPFLAFRDDKVYLCGTPWRGKHNIGQNIEVALAGICVLKRGEVNKAHRLEPFDAVNEVIQQSSLHSYKSNSLLALDLIDKLLKIVPVYELFCTPTIDAVDVCCNAIME